MKSRRFNALATEILKTVNEVNPNFMKNIFTSKTRSTFRPFNLKSMVAKVSWRWGQKYGMRYLKI